MELLDAMLALQLRLDALTFRLDELIARADAILQERETPEKKSIIDHL
jgi:hypothetical protein